VELGELDKNAMTRNVVGLKRCRMLSDGKAVNGMSRKRKYGLTVRRELQ